MILSVQILVNKTITALDQILEALSEARARALSIMS